MPYARIADLPPGVKNALPPRAQQVFLAAFNGASKRGLSEERAFKSAWGAVKNAGWSPPKGGKGKWTKTEKSAQPAASDVHVDHPSGPEDDRKRRRRKKPKLPVDDDKHEAHHKAQELPLAETVEKSADEARPDSPAIEVAIAIAKNADGEPMVNEDQKLVFGWLSVVEENGYAVVDAHGHVIETAELERAAYDFVKNSRIAGEMHERIGVGEGMVESMVFTLDKQQALGIDLGKVGWWIGFRVDDEAFAKVKSGELTAFSIGGHGVLEQIQEQ